MRHSSLQIKSDANVKLSQKPNKFHTWKTFLMLLPTFFSACKYIYLSEISFATKTNKEKKETNKKKTRPFFKEWNWIMLFKFQAKPESSERKKRKTRKDLKPKVSYWITSFPFIQFSSVWFHSIISDLKKHNKRLVCERELFEMVISLWLIYMPFNVHLSIGKVSLIHFSASSGSGSAKNPRWEKENPEKNCFWHMRVLTVLVLMDFLSL